MLANGIPGGLHFLNVGNFPMSLSAEFRPRLACTVSTGEESILLTRDGLEFAIEPEESSLAELHTFLTGLDGSRRLLDIQRDFDASKRVRLDSVIADLDRHALLDDAEPVRARSGSQALMDLEDLANELMEETIYRNVFWVNVHSDASKCPPSAFFGLALENYHFLTREALFDSPVLPFVSNTKARQLINEFYISEYGHDELVLRALNAIGISREDAQDSMPLPQTLALCNALSYWASNDPIFFFATLGVLEGKDTEEDLFIAACERNTLPPDFIGPMRQHSNINRNSEHGNLTRLIFAEIPLVDDETMARLRRQTKLFVKMYDDFYTAIWEHYAPISDFLRPMSAI